MRTTNHIVKETKNGYDFYKDLCFKTKHVSNMILFSIREDFLGQLEDMVLHFINLILGQVIDT